MQKKAKGKGQAGRAWHKAYDSLRASISRGKRLSLALMEPAIKLAEAHLRETSSPSKDDKTTNAVKQDKGEKSDEPATKRGHHAARKDRKKIRDLQAQLAQATGGKSAPPSPGKRKPGTAPGTPKGPGRGEHCQDREERDCKDCGTRHWGKCLKDRVREKRERLKEDEEKLRKLEQSVGKKAAAAARAQPAWESDNSNESDEACFCVT